MCTRPTLPALLLIATVAARPGIGLASAPVPDSPAGVLRVLADAYSRKSLEELAGLYAADFKFTSTSMESVAIMQNFGRELELRSADALFHGLKVDGRLVKPPADSVRIHISGVSEAPDPEHADSVASYRLVAVHGFEFEIYVPGRKTMMAAPALHVFQMVRGDAAMLAEGQPPDSTRWYLRRWFEDVDGIARALSEKKGDCHPAPMGAAREEGGAPVAPRGPLALAIHPLGNPACPAMDVMCDLPTTEPASFEVFDVTGRRVNRQKVEIRAPGTQRLQAGAGADIRPGAYWVRLVQGRRVAIQMIVVAK